MQHLLALLVALALSGCSAESDGPNGDAGAESCPAPGRLVDGACREPGVQDDGCPAGSWLEEDGSCQPPGIPPESCAEGFAATDSSGCEPILPSAPCSTGQMAVPGETECREVSPCGSGRWGAIPLDATAVYVDQSYDLGAGSSDGTESRPYRSIGEAVVAASPGALIAIAQGSYAEDVGIADKPVRLWGVCPALVEVQGSPDGEAAVDIGTGADGTEVRSLAIRGDSRGLRLSGSQAVLLDRLWVHDTAQRGIFIDNTLGFSSATIAGVLVEGCRGYGVFVTGSEATVDGTLVRSTLPELPSQLFGRGLTIRQNRLSGERANVTVRGSLVEQNHEVGLFVAGSDATIEATVVRDTLPQATGEPFGRGILIQPGSYDNARANVTVSGSLVEQNHYFGVFVAASDASIEATVVRGTLPPPPGTELGRGINIQHDLITGARSNVLVRASLIEQNQSIGVFIAGSDTEVDRVVVRNSAPLASADETEGRGIAVYNDIETGARADVLVRASLIEQSQAYGVVVAGSDAELDGIVVRDTSPNPHSQDGGSGIQIQRHADGDVRASVLLHASRIEQSYEVGVAVCDSDAQLLGVMVADTMARPFDGLFGDGVLVWSAGGEARIELTSSHVGPSARAGVSSFGGAASIHSSNLSCNAIHLAAETYSGRSGSFTDGGKNRCFCGDAEQTCKVLSVGLEPPPPLE